MYPHAHLVDQQFMLSIMPRSARSCRSTLWSESPMHWQPTHKSQIFKSKNIFVPEPTPARTDKTIYSHFVVQLGTQREAWHYSLLNIDFLHSLSLGQRISQEEVKRNNYSNIMKVIHFTSVYPLANPSSERGLSTMKRVKSDWRCTLGNNTKEMLTRVKIEGPKKQADYHPRAAENRWWMSGQRQRRPQN